MKDFPVIPPVIVKDTLRPRRLTTLEEVREYVDEAMRLGRPAPWRKVRHRLKTVASEEEAIEGQRHVRFGSKADIGAHSRDVRYVPKADIRHQVRIGALIRSA